MSIFPDGRIKDACVNEGIIDSGVFKSPTITVWECKSFYGSLRTCFMYLGAPALGAYI